MDLMRETMIQLFSFLSAIPTYIYMYFVNTHGEHHPILHQEASIDQPRKRARSKGLQAGVASHIDNHIQDESKEACSPFSSMLFFGSSVPN